MTHVGKYQLVSKLATGGMAEVFLARVEGPRGFEKLLVLKRILPHLAEDPQFVEMFFTEARVAAQLNHPHIVHIFDFGQAEGTHYLAMEYIDGPDLRTLFTRAQQAGVALPPAFCAKLVSAACDALAFAHDFVDPVTGKPMELVHRDISPDNILLSRQGAVKVVDFGIAKASNQSHKTQAGLIKGKIAYMPSEQLKGLDLDRRVDVYALGVVLYELLTGRHPFEATTDVSMMQAILNESLVPAASRRPDLPEALTLILDKALSKAREQRYPDCLALQADLERFILSTGESMGPRELAQWVEKLCPKGSEAARPLLSGEPDSIGLEPTTISPGNTPADPLRPALLASPRDGAGPQPTFFLGEVDARPSESGKALTLPSARRRVAAEALPVKADVSPGPRRSRVGLWAWGGLAVLAAGGGLLLFRGSPPPEVPPVPTSVEAQAQAAPPTVAPPAQPVEEKKAPMAAQVPAAPETSAREPAASRPEGEAPVRHKGSQKAKLVFRIRPYATVLVDGTAVGQTPFAPVPLSAGAHTVRLINRELGKDVTRTVEVKAGQSNIFKFNLSAD